MEFLISIYSNHKSAVKIDDKLSQSCTCKEWDARCHLLFLISIGRTTHVTRDMCFPGWERRITMYMCCAGREKTYNKKHVLRRLGTHTTRDMCFPGQGTQITRDMCFTGKGTYNTRNLSFPGGATCFPGWGTHITRDTCFQDRRTHITRNMGFTSRRSHITKGCAFLRLANKPLGICVCQVAEHASLGILPKLANTYH